MDGHGAKAPPAKPAVEAKAAVEPKAPAAANVGASGRAQSSLAATSRAPAYNSSRGSASVPARPSGASAASPGSIQYSLPDSIHGASSNLLAPWGPLAEEFSPLHRVIAYDRPGMGHSTRMKRDGELRRDTVVATVMSNLGLERAIEALGARLLRTPVGDRYVVEAMRRHGANLGGEQSGHLIFLDHASTGDGIIGALQVLALMLRTGRPLSELARGSMERVPQVLENVTLPARRPLEDMAALQRLVEQVKASLGREGRVLVRWSGTEPKLRVMVEGPDEGRIGTIASDLVAAARKDVS